MENTLNTVQPAKKRKKRKFSWDDLELFFLTIPTTIWYILFCYMPMFGIIIAFKENYRPVRGQSFFVTLLKSKWVGLDNLQYLFISPDTLNAIRNTILYNIAFIVLGLIVSVTLAILISQLYSSMYAKVCQTAMFLPHFLSWVVVSYFLYAFLGQQYGLANRLITALGGEPVRWYQETKYWPYIIIFMSLWKSVGYNMVVYLASLSGIDTTYYEAALIDGATKWQQVKYITLPMLRTIMTILFILAVGKIFNSDFGLFYQLPRNSGAITSVTQTLDVMVYKALTSLNRPNLAQAAGLVQSTAGLITIMTANMIVKKIDADSSLF